MDLGGSVTPQIEGKKAIMLAQKKNVTEIIHWFSSEPHLKSCSHENMQNDL